jgi:MFS family permease
MRALLRNRDARIFLTGWSIYSFGDSAMFLVLGIWAGEGTDGSNSVDGLVFFAIALPSLLSPLSGLIVDRVRRRPLLIVVNCLLGAAVLLLLFVTIATISG